VTSDAKPRLDDIRDRIAKAAKLADRDPNHITLIAVSKTHDADSIRQLIAAGQTSFGENRVQEAEAKWPLILESTPGLDLHHIGQLQSNKAEDALRLFGTIHGVDRESLVTAIARAQDKSGNRPRCFLQVNVGDEPQKGGCAIAELGALLGKARVAGLDVAGLMAIPPVETEAAPYFALLAKLAKDHGVTGLSMGMSADFETAVMLGATHVRVGSALFGARA
jgi:PLP dependent protein